MADRSGYWHGIAARAAKEDFLAQLVKEAHADVQAMRAEQGLRPWNFSKGPRQQRDVDDVLDEIAMAEWCVPCYRSQRPGMKADYVVDGDPMCAGCKSAALAQDPNLDVEMLGAKLESHEESVVDTTVKPFCEHQAVKEETVPAGYEKTKAGIVKIGKCSVAGCEERRHPADCTGYCKSHKQKIGIVPGGQRSSQKCACGCNGNLAAKAAARGVLFIWGHKPNKAAKIQPAPHPEPERSAPRVEAATAPQYATSKDLYTAALEHLRKDIAAAKEDVLRLESLQEKLAQAIATEKMLRVLVEGPEPAVLAAAAGGAQ